MTHNPWLLAPFITLVLWAVLGIAFWIAYAGPAAERRRWERLGRKDDR